MELETFLDIIASVMEVSPDSISLNTSFKDDLNCDSLDIADILLGVESELDIEIPLDVADRIETVSDAMEEIKKALN